MGHTTVNTGIDTLTNWHTSSSGDKRGSTDNRYKDWLNDMRVGFYEEADYGTDWAGGGSGVDVETTFPGSPSSGVTFLRKNTNGISGVIREYIYNGTAWVYGRGQADDIVVNSIQFNLTPTVVETEALIWWNSVDKTVNIKTDTDTVIQTGQEVIVRAINKTGAQLDNGTVVYINGADVTADRPTATKADASTWEDSQMTIGVMTSDVADDAEGFITVLGYVRDVDTSGMTAGDRIYLSETTGAYTTTRPISPAYIIDLGVVVKVNATTGIIFVNVINRDDYGFQNKSFIEEFDLTVAEDTGSVIASLQKTGGGNLTMRFSTGPFTTLVTPPMTKTLTPGTATVPQQNFLYILESDQTQITLSTSSYPDDSIEHIRIAEVILLTAAITALDDPLANQNVNDHAFEHMSHVTEWIRAQRATYKSPGIDGNSSTGHDYFEIETVPDKVYFRSTAGTIRQMHLQAYPVKDTGSIDGGGSDVMYVVNDPDAAYTRITDLIAGITKISDGTAWGNNKYIGLVFFGVISKSGEGQQLMCLLPSGQYNSQLGAENDTNGFTNVSIPEIYSGTGFLICKIVAQKVGSTIAYKSTLDLRGTFPSLLTGAGGGAAIVSFPDNTFNIFDEADPTKKITFQASGITTANTRVVTMPNFDVTLHNIVSTLAALDTTMTGAELEDLATFGAANAAFVPCSTISFSAGEAISDGGTGLRNRDGTDSVISFVLPRPTNLGGLALHIVGVRIPVSDADANDFINRILITRANDSTFTTLYDDSSVFSGTPSAQLLEDGTGALVAYGTADDVSDGHFVFVTVVWTVTTVADLDHGMPLLECYYA